MSDEKRPSRPPPASEPHDPPAADTPAPFDDDALRKLVKRAMTEPAADTSGRPAPGADTIEEAPPSVDDVPLPPDAEEDVAMQTLLRQSALREPLVVPDLVSGVQRKLRKRSRGKFYRDRFSTTQSRVSYALVAVAMLVVVALAYLILGPTSVSGH